MPKSAIVYSYLHRASLSWHLISRCHFRICCTSYGANNELSQSAMDNSFPVGLFALSDLCQPDKIACEVPCRRDSVGGG